MRLPGGIETDARACVVRRREGRLHDAVAVDGTDLAIDGKRLRAATLEKLVSRKP